MNAYKMLILNICDYMCSLLYYFIILLKYGKIISINYKKLDTMSILKILRNM